MTLSDNKRKRIPKDVETRLLSASKRRCCLCVALNQDLRIKQGQIAHLDNNRTNNNLDNLAWLCLEHHDQYDTRTSQSKGITKEEVKLYRFQLESTWEVIDQKAIDDYTNNFSALYNFEESYQMEVINRKFSQHIPVVAICQYDEDIAKILRFLLREEFKDIRISIYDRSEFLIKIVNSSYNMLIIDDDSRREDRKIVLAARKILPHAFIVSSLVMLRQDDIREAYRHGADRVLIKPSPFENLTNFVREAYKLE